MEMLAVQLEVSELLIEAEVSVHKTSLQRQADFTLAELRSLSEA